MRFSTNHWNPWTGIWCPKGVQRAPWGTPVLLFLGAESVVITDVSWIGLFLERARSARARTRFFVIFKIIFRESMRWICFKNTAYFNNSILGHFRAERIFDAKKRVLGPEFWASESSIILITPDGFWIFYLCEKFDCLMSFLRGAKNVFLK